ncbi:MAG: HAD-IA family hydrolase [Lachnospiraceae bacterium]|nr:HAD-IA family hydrolase [Lachnospiraceae bacterium]
MKRVEYISFDIFDTLLFRMARAPYQIFDKTYEEAPALFPDYISACEWREIRAYAEKYAREKKGEREITLEDIYRELPDIIQNQKEILELEIATERKNGYLNPQIVDLLYELKRVYRKKILLISDMYLSEEAIRGILEAARLALTEIDHIYISSEYGNKKSDGTLYEFVCKDLQCEPGKILHIGDNWTADYLNAKKMGLQAVYYPVISEGRYRYPYLEYEQEYYGDVSREIHAIRLLAAESCLKGEEREWFEIGAIVLGPLLTYAAEWVLDLAEQNHISRIHPMMREGYFLARLLEGAAKRRGWKGAVVPMYLSRRALYPALLSVAKKKDMDYLLSTRKMTVGTVLRMFEAEKLRLKLQEYEEETLLAAREIWIGEKNVYQILEESFSKPEVIENIRKSHEHADRQPYHDSYF